MAYGTICELLLKANLLDEAHAAVITLESSQQQITAGQYLYASGSMDAGLVRGAILSLVLINDMLLPPPKAISILRLIASEGLSFEDSSTKVNWNRKYYEHVALITSLLRLSGAVSDANLRAARDFCFPKEKPIVKILAEKKVFPATFGNDLLTVEKLVLHNLLSFDVAVKILRIMREQQQPVEAAIEACQKSATPVKKNPMLLGELLLASRHVTAVDLIGAVELGLYEGVRLGEVMLAYGFLTETTLSKALDIQKKVAAGVLQPVQGIELMKSLRASQV